MMLFSHKGTIFTHNTKGLPRLDTGIFLGGGFMKASHYIK